LFNKVGTLCKISKIEILNDLNSWDNFKKTASSTAKEEDAASKEKESTNKDAEYSVVGNIDSENFIFVHSTIMAAVKTGDNGFFITPETEKFINDNHDSWKDADLIKDYKSFKNALTFVEHDQNVERAKGKCIDVLARRLPDTILIDVLFSVAKRHEDLIANIKTGIINAVSMGCTTEETVCSICGNVAKDSSEYCSHIKNGKGRMFECSDGVKRKAAELCKKNSFFDVSLVANPVFAGAIFRKVLSSSEVSNHFLAKILESNMSNFIAVDKNSLLKAASKEDNKDINLSISNEGVIRLTFDGITRKSTLTDKDLQSLNDMIDKTAIENNKKKVLFGTIIDKVLGKKKADTFDHPIQDLSTSKEFSIDREDYSDIEIVPPHDIKEEFEKQDKMPKKTILKKGEKVSRFANFECPNCKHEEELWTLKAASIDEGQGDVIVCPKCKIKVESSIFDDGQEKVEKVNASIEKILKNANKGLIFKVSRDIPVDYDDGVYWHDEGGNSIITKDEELSFVTTAQNGEYGLFRTEEGEDVFLPL